MNKAGQAPYQSKVGTGQAPHQSKLGTGQAPYQSKVGTGQAPKTLLANLGIAPKKRLGQHFLVDQRVLGKILRAADISSQDTVLEIGPGLGILTQALAEKAKRVIAVEKDPTLAHTLKSARDKTWPNVRVVRGDILRLKIPNPKDTSYKIQAARYKVVANLPYYITSPVIRKFLETEQRPDLMVLMVQKEVAQRICAKPPDMNLLAVSVQYYGKPEIVSSVSRHSFWPVPKVDSAILKITPQKPQSQETTIADFRDSFFRIVRAGFKHPRKQLGNNLSKNLGRFKKQARQMLLRHKIDPKRRAQTLSLSEWLSLATTENS